MPKTDTPKLDITKAIQLRVRHEMSYQQIADYFGVSKQCVHSQMRKHIPEYLELENFVKNKDIHLQDQQFRMLKHLSDDKLAKASARDLGILFAIMYDKERIETGQSTGNTSVILRTIGEANKGKCASVTEDTLASPSGLGGGSTPQEDGG